jgi:hypothetical protein
VRTCEVSLSLSRCIPRALSDVMSAVEESTGLRRDADGCPGRPAGPTAMLSRRRPPSDLPCNGFHGELAERLSTDDVAARLFLPAACASTRRRS